MVAAAACGALDFREADPGDRRWWFKLRLVLDHIERADVARQYRLYYDYDLAVLSRSDLTEQAYRQFVGDANRHLTGVVSRWRPWERRDPEGDRQSQADALAAAWQREYGDPNDPRTRQAIAETVRMLEKMTRARAPKHVPAAFR